MPRHSVTGSFHHFRLDTPNSVFNDIDAVFPGRPGAGQGSRRNLAEFGLISDAFSAREIQIGMKLTF